MPVSHEPQQTRQLAQLPPIEDLEVLFPSVLPQGSMLNGNNSMLSGNNSQEYSSLVAVYSKCTMTLTFENFSLGGMRGQRGVNSRDDVAASFTPPTAGERPRSAMSGASGARSSPRLSPRVNVTPPWELKSQLAELRRMHAEIEVANVSSSSHQVQERRQSQYEGALSQMHRPAHEQVNVAPHFEPILKQKASLIRTHPHPQQLQRRAAQAPTGGGVEKKTETSMERLRDVKVPQLSFPDSILADRDHTAQAVVRSSDPHEVPHPQGRRGAGV